MAYKIVDLAGKEYVVPRDVEFEGGAALEAWAKANVAGYPFPVKADAPEKASAKMTVTPKAKEA